MRIAIVQAGIGAGGAERVISMLAQDRCRRGDEVHVLAFSDDTEAPYFPLDPRVRLHCLGAFSGVAGGNSLWRALKKAVALRKVLADIQPDILLSYLTKINVLSLLASLGTQLPVIISERNNPQRQRRHRLWDFFAAVLFPRAAAIVAQTVTAKRQFPSSLQRLTEVIPNPCRSPEWDTRNSRDEDADRQRIVAVGRLTEQKGFDILVEAFALIADKYPNWTLTIYGEGPDRDLIEAEISAQGLHDRVCLPGITETPGSWIADAAVFVLSSRYEGFPNVLVEAMAAGLPVVASACDYGPREIITDGLSGILVDPECPVALAQGLDRALSSRELRQHLGRNASTSVTQYSESRVMEQWNDLFSRTLVCHRVAAPAEVV